MLKVVFNVVIPNDGVTEFTRNFSSSGELHSFLTEIYKNIQCKVSVGLNSILIVLDVKEE